jgi:hypothetical protein
MAQPVSRDGFFHDGTSFWVEVESNRHPRADSKSLRALLVVEATSNSAPQKDKPTHFYIAQLKHYGLKHLKTKGPAKAALLEALNQKPKLAVPPHILQIEKSLKEGYLRISGASGAGDPPSKKRKMDQRNEADPPTTVAAKPVAQPRQPNSNPDTASVKPPPAARITRSQKELVDKMVELPKPHLHKVLVDLIKQNPGLEEKIREKVGNKRVRAAGPSAGNDKVRSILSNTSHIPDLAFRRPVTYRVKMGVDPVWMWKCRTFFTGLMTTNLKSSNHSAHLNRGPGAQAMVFTSSHPHQHCYTRFIPLRIEGAFNYRSS